MQSLNKLHNHQRYYVEYGTLVFHYAQVDQLSQTNRIAAWLSFGKNVSGIWIVCTKCCRCQKTRSIDLFTRYLCTTEM